MEKILIIDDQLGIRLLLTEVFKKEGYITAQASNGVEALAMLEQDRPDLVLLDMKLPGMDGLEILRRIRKIDSDLKVIMMTAYGELDMIQEAKQLGALKHFTKPFDIDEMRLEVQAILRDNT